VANLRHKWNPDARISLRAAKVAAPIAVFATLASVAVGVVATDVEDNAGLAAASRGSLADVTVEREQQVSRSAPRITDRVTPAERRAAARKEAARKAAARLEAAIAKEDAGDAAAVAGADTPLWTTEELNLWDSSFESATLHGTIEAGKKVLVTGREAHGRTEVALDGKSRWVTSGYLDDEKPEPEPTISNAACTNGTSVSSGVSGNVVAVHRAVCANFPEITTYGDFRGDGEHAEGRALDIMVSGDRGWEVAEFVRANYAELGVEYVMYAQKIWSVDRSSEGWRYVEDRGSDTANHYDHVHVTTY
jgi:hypothetical protein